VHAKVNPQSVSGRGQASLGSLVRHSSGADIGLGSPGVGQDLVTLAPRLAPHVMALPGPNGVATLVDVGHVAAPSQDPAIAKRRHQSLMCRSAGSSEVPSWRLSQGLPAFVAGRGSFMGLRPGRVPWRGVAQLGLHR